MCGVAGIFDLKGEREIDRDALTRMTNALRHRGPDGEGFFVEPGIGLGHRRLAIIDLEGGAQPFHTASEQSVLCFNGEIYNYRELSQQFRNKGGALRTQSDTEILAEGLERNGLDFIHELRGMYAWAYWNKSKKRLTLARDRLGEKPLYYTQTTDGFLLFASEIGAILASGLVEKTICNKAVADYFFYGYTPDPKTIYENIYKLPPGHTLSVSAGQPLDKRRYWRPVFAPRDDLSFEDATALMRKHLDDAVAAQMVSDVPLGAFLSGGVDSAGVVSSMREAGGDLVTCTIGFNEQSHDERDAARDIAVKFGAEHHEHLAELHVAELIDKIARAYGEPFADTSALPSYLVAKLARQHVTVALSGDGGDEIFAGIPALSVFSGGRKDAIAGARLHQTAHLWPCCLSLSETRLGAAAITFQDNI